MLLRYPAVQFALQHGGDVLVRQRRDEVQGEPEPVLLIGDRKRLR